MNLSARARPLLGTVLLVIACIGFAATAAAAGPDAAAPATSRSFEWWKFLGPFHAVALHYPIGFVTAVFLLEVFTILRPCYEIRRAITIIMGFAAVSTLVAIALGLMLAAAGGYEPRALSLHKWLGIGTGVLIVVAWLDELFRKRFGAGPRWLWGYRALLTCTMLLIVAAGHQGGNLTHGSDFLTKEAPHFVREFVEKIEPVAAPAPEVPGDPGERLFAETIRPIFKTKCYGCHGPDKHKGDYRLDQRDVAFAGGESGDVAIKPGAPFASQLVRMIMLPEDDDEVMPPRGKEALTPEEIVAVVRWIQGGAPFVESHLSADSPPSLSDGAGTFFK